MTPKFTDQVTQALNQAHQLAEQEKKIEVTTSHLLWSLLEEENGYFQSLVRALSLDPASCLQKAKKTADAVPVFSLEPESPFFSSSLQKTIVEALALAKKWSDTYISADHLLYVLWKEDKEPISSWRKESKLSLSDVEQQIKKLRHQAKHQLWMPIEKSYFLTSNCAYTTFTSRGTHLSNEPQPFP